LPYDPKQLRKMQPYPPLGMLYAASALREAGISVAAFDPMLEEPSRGFSAALAAHRPRIVVVYEDDFNFLSKMCLSRMREVAWEIARAAKERGAATVVHGSDSTDNARLFLQNGFDYVLCGEAEQTLVQLCGALPSGASVPELDGMVRCDSDGALMESAKRLATNPEWTEIRMPARDLIDMAPYRTAWREAHGYFSTSIVSSRGCPYRCNWCAKPISGNRFHLRPAEAVAAEMKQLKNAAGVEHIWFGDDVFALNQEWVGQFAEAVTRQNAAIPFKIQSRANLMTEATVRDLKAAGCAEVWMGVESGSQAVLNAMDKGLTVESIIAARERLGRAGIRACYFLQLGYPGERWRELQQTIALVRATRPDDIGVSLSYPLPGTVFYEKVQAQLGRKRNWVDSDDLCIIFTGAYKTELYRAVRDALHAEVDSWRSPGNANETPSRVDDLWRTVWALEPVSRNPDAFDLSEQPPRVPSGVVLPVGQLLSSAKA
jgi:radical SAM superfamily enzyme YgiQ (UPF0313 family)